MFVDEIDMRAGAGRGGDGVVRWLREKGRPHGGPAGGNGGKGGDVIARGVRDLGRLAQYRYIKDVKAERGEDGKNNNQEGKNGEDFFLDVPVGTRITNTRTHETFEILTEEETQILLRGGNGGYGNAYFKGSTNQYPTESTKGKEGEEAFFHIELQLIADVGLIGLPNAGKSSLLNALTNAHSKIGAYPFTTLEPHLGDFHGKLLADIPGLVEGASEGKGLGDKFLRHINRTKIVAHLISLESDDLAQDYAIIRKELENFNSDLSEKTEIILLSKADLVSNDELAEKIEGFRNMGREALPFSILDEGSLKRVSDTLSNALS
jgi:GTP-binding protein